MAIDRRRFPHAGVVASLGGIAGCSAPSNNGAGDTPTSRSTDSAALTEGRATTTPGADRLGGPDDLQSSVSAVADTLEEDQGAGQFVFTPAVIWLESGGTIEWSIEGAAHSVTAYHPDNDKPSRIPEDTKSFDSGTLDAGASYEHTFETPGVYNYYCTPHESLGMVGVVIVDEVTSGPITDPSGAAAENLERQLTEVAWLTLSEGQGATSYGWQDATWDSYRYSLYNMSTNVAMSGNGVLFPHNDEQQEAFDKRFPAMLKAADQEMTPVKRSSTRAPVHTTTPRCCGSWAIWSASRPADGPATRIRSR
jgi:plastocyanin